MGDERGDDAADRRRADVFSSARIGAAAALTIVLVVLLVLDVVVPDYSRVAHRSPVEPFIKQTLSERCGVSQVRQSVSQRVSDPVSRSCRCRS